MNDAEAKDRLIEEVVDAFTAMRERGMRGLHRIRRDVASMGHLQVLVRLQADGPLPAGAVARSLGVSAASATGMLRRMAERGLVRRIRDEKDRRVVRIELAPAGTSLLEKLSRNRSGLHRSLSRLDEDELRQLRNGLIALNRATLELAEEEDTGEEDTEPGDEERRPNRHRETPHASEDPE
jgi:DNA-binding MarR family transcriptional regulator